MPRHSIPHSPLTALSIIGAAALVLRAISTLVINPDFGVPGDGWRSLMQLVVAAALVVGVLRSAASARRTVFGVAMVYVLMTVWERFDGDDVFGIITVTQRDHWAHPAIAAIAGVTATLDSRRNRSPRTVTVARAIQAPALALFAIVSDPTLMGRLSPETTRCEWIGEARGVGGAFVGFNTSDARTWSTTCVITRCEQDRRFEFEVRRPARIARWTYEFAATDLGCDVRETWADLRNPLVRIISARRSGVSDRAAHNARTMATTLSNLEQLVARR